MTLNGFELTCPKCGSPLVFGGSREARCTFEGDVFPCIDGIYRFLLPDRQQYFSSFMDDYQRIRRAEGRADKDPIYYRSLPYLEPTYPESKDWRIRATSFKVFTERVLQPLETEIGSPLKCLDMGAGTGWLSNRLVLRGHQAAAIDLLTNDWDGLGAHNYYQVPILPVQAEFDRLPFASQQCDLAIFNASLHYSPDYLKSLREVTRVLKSTGKIIVLDTPVYHSAESGRQMVLERRALFTKLYGLPSDALPSENFLTYTRIEELSNLTGIRWKFIEPYYGIRWAVRPWIARILRRREPAKFVLLIGEPEFTGQI
jgi:SAM-dependent methyltransferase